MKSEAKDFSWFIFYFLHVVIDIAHVESDIPHVVSDITNAFLDNKHVVSDITH